MKRVGRVSSARRYEGFGNHLLGHASRIEGALRLFVHDGLEPRPATALLREANEVRLDQLPDFVACVLAPSPLQFARIDEVATVRADRFPQLSMPSPVVATVCTIGGVHGAAGANPSITARSSLGIRVGPIRLVYDEDVGDFEESGLIACTPSPQPGLTTPRWCPSPRRYRFPPDQRNRLDHDPWRSAASSTRIAWRVAAASSQLPSSRHRADEDSGIGRVRTHADAVAEDGTTGTRARWIDGEHRHRVAERAQHTDEPIGERRLANARRAGDADGVGMTAVGCERRHCRAGCLLIGLDERQQARHAGPVTASDALDEARGVGAGTRQAVLVPDRHSVATSPGLGVPARPDPVAPARQPD